MSLLQLNRRLRLWTRTFAGQLSVLMLLAALIPGARVALEHAHDGGDHAHGHSASVASDHGMVVDAGEQDGTKLHQHDVGTTVSDLPPPVLLHTLSLAPEHLRKRLIGVLPPSSPRSPPHRPPIA